MEILRRRFLLGSAVVAAGCATASDAPRHDHATPDPQAVPPEGLVDLSMGYGSDTVRLHKNENPFGPSPPAVEAAEAALSHANRYVNPVELIERIAARHGFDPRMIQIGSGSNEILHALPLAFMRDGGNLVTAVQSYRQVPQTAALLGREVRWVPLREDFGWDVPAMVSAVDANTRLVVVVNPNNPTGTMLTRAEISDLAEAIPPSTLLVVDEAYVEFLPAEEGSSIELVHEIPNLIVVRTFSKAYGLAGLRLGYAVARIPVIAELHPFVSTWPNIAAFAGCAAALGDTDHVRRYTEHARRCAAFYREQLKALGLPHQIGHAPVALVRLGAERVPRAVAALERESILVRNGHIWGMDDWIRITYGLDDDNARVIEQLRAWATPQG